MGVLTERQYITPQLANLQSFGQRRTAKRANAGLIRSLSPFAIL
jgi:hypothetical protein